MQALDTAFPGNPLDEVGLGQADGLPDRLDKAGLLQGLGSLWVSPILRARQTIAPIEAATGLSAKPGWTTHRFAVAAANPLATDAGYQVLRAGGVAFWTTSLEDCFAQLKAAGL